MNDFIRLIRTILISFFVVWAIIWFSIRSYKQTENKGEEAGILAKTVTALFETPYMIKQYFESSVQAVDLKDRESLTVIGERIDGFEINDSFYMLHAQLVDPSLAQVSLQNLKTGEVAHSWDISLKMLMKDVDSIRREFDEVSSKENGPKNLKALLVKNSRALLIRHPLMLRDSSLLFKVQYLGHLYKIDKNSKLIWKSKRLAHHSIELDSEENIWTCSVSLENETANFFQYRDDALLCLDQSGNERYFASLTDIFKNNELFKTYIEASPVESNEAGIDPFHLNEIQPVLKDGKYWKKGDLFLSLRHKSIVALFRPSTGKMLLTRQGPWFKQHDVNIENDSVISIFNNNSSFVNLKINTSSNIANFNLADSSVQYITEGDYSSVSEGRQTSLSNGDIIVESTNEGQYFYYGSDQELKGKLYVPFLPDPEKAQYPGWSRFYRKTADGFVEE